MTYQRQFSVLRYPITNRRTSWLAGLLVALSGCEATVFAPPPSEVFTGVPEPSSAAIFVDKNSTAAHEDGSASAPFRTITRALDHARAIRFGALEPGGGPSPQRITVHVAPSATPYVGSFNPAVFDPASPSYDPSKERLPLMLNIPRLDLRGGTSLTEAADGLPFSVQPGTETILRADQPQAPKQYLVMVTRTNPTSASGFHESIEMAGDDVTITGLWIQAEALRQLPSTLIGVDAVSDFVVRGNVLVGGGMGVWTRLASGRIEGNLSVNNTVGFFVTGGSARLPASVRVRGNRATSDGSSVGSINLVGSGEAGNRRRDLDFGANPYRRVLLPAVYDVLANPLDVPNLLRAEVLENEFSGNSQFGIRVSGYIQDPYIAAPNQDEVGQVEASFKDNVSRSNGTYGLVVDAGQIPQGDRRTLDFDLSFEGTTLEQNRFGPAIVTFWRYAGSIALSPPPGLVFGGDPAPFSVNPTFAHDSAIRICGDVTQFHYDNRQDPHPPTNPAPTNNRLEVNNVELEGLWIHSLYEVPLTSPSCGGF